MQLSDSSPGNLAAGVHHSGDVLVRCWEARQARSEIDGIETKNRVSRVTTETREVCRFHVSPSESFVIRVIITLIIRLRLCMGADEIAGCIKVVSEVLHCSFSALFCSPLAMSGRQQKWLLLLKFRHSTYL